MRFALAALAAVALLAVSVRAEISSECLGKPQCLLTSNHCQKPVPSLTQCYKYNQESCCVAGHDAVIKSSYESLWSTTCLREYANLELLYCLGCNLDQGKYVDATNKIVRVCQSFADELFDFSTSTRTLYDNCGVLLKNGDVLLPGTATDVNGAPLFQNATAFLNYAYWHESENVYPFRSPFFTDYMFQVVPDANNNCFTAGAAQAVLSALAASVVAMVVFVLA